MRPAVPDGHPKAWKFESVSDGWDHTPAVNNRVVCEDVVRVPGDDERGEPDDAVSVAVAVGL